MENKSFERETSYQVTMNLFRQLLKQGVINKDEYNKIDTKMIEKYQPVKVSRDDIPLTKTSTKEETSQDDGLTQMCGGYTIDELHNALREEHDNPGSTALKDVMKLYE